MSPSSQSSTTSLTVLHTGTVVIDEALPYHRDDDAPLAWTHALRGPDHLVTAPVSAYLIENAHGLTLIDTGWHPVNRGRGAQVTNLRQQYPVNKAVLPDGQALVEQLEDRGIRPRDLDLVLMSHLHCDHADGLRTIAEAPRILVSGPELKAARRDRLRYLPHELDGVELETFGWNTMVGPYDAGYDVLGDGSLVMVAVPGHSRGLCATILRSADAVDPDAPDELGGRGTWVEGVDDPWMEDERRFVLLTSDVGYGRPSFEEGLRPGVVINAGWAERSLAWVREVEHDPRCLGLIANHDPEVPAGTLLL